MSERRTCPQCWAVINTASDCPRCGYDPRRWTWRRFAAGDFPPVSSSAWVTLGFVALGWVALMLLLAILRALM